jgi:hypothetical protein
MERAQDISFASTSIEDLTVQHEVDVDPQSGAGLASVPLPLTGGRSDFGPSLRVQYTSSAGNSAFGVGWSLAGLPAISTNTRKSLPRYDGRDSYAFGGGDALERWEPGHLELGKKVLARTRGAGNRSQFEGTWQVGQTLPFGLYEVGDSEMSVASS